MRESGRRACVLLGPSPSGLPRVLRRALGVQPGSPRAPAPGQGWGRGPRPHSNPDPRAPPGGQQPYHLSGAAPPAGQRGALRAGGAPRQQPRGEAWGSGGRLQLPPAPAGRPRGLEASWGWRDGQSRPARVPPTARVRLAQSRVGSAEGPRPGPQLRPPFPGPRTGGNLSPGRLHAALGAGGTKAAFPRAGLRVPKDHGATAGLSNPHCPAHRAMWMSR